MRASAVESHVYTSGSGARKCVNERYARVNETHIFVTWSVEAAQKEYASMKRLFHVGLKSAHDLGQRLDVLFKKICTMRVSLNIWLNERKLYTE